ncbi:MAG: HAD family hydrolase [Thermoplasmata archaeon]|nr:HAD family hydrolase [Thermoplasmata archaeon]
MAAPEGRAIEVRAVLFDLDETLVPLGTVQRWQWAWRPNGPVLSERHAQAAIRRERHAWDRRRWKGLVGSEPATDAEEYRNHVAATLRAIADRTLPEEEVEAVVDRFLKASGPIEPFPDVGPALRLLEERSLPFRVLTPIPDEAARGLLKRAGISPDQLSARKPGDPPPPDRRAFRQGAEALGVPYSEVLMVGDLYWSDARAAARAGLRAVWLDREGRDPAVQGARISSLAELDSALRDSTGDGEGPPASAPPP